MNIRAILENNNFGWLKVQVYVVNCIQGKKSEYPTTEKLEVAL